MNCTNEKVNTYQCADYTCIDPNRLCDGIIDCRDDEISCPIRRSDKLILIWIFVMVVLCFLLTFSVTIVCMLCWRKIYDTKGIRIIDTGSTTCGLDDTVTTIQEVTMQRAEQALPVVGYRPIRQREPPLQPSAPPSEDIAEYKHLSRGPLPDSDPPSYHSVINS